MCLTAWLRVATGLSWDQSHRGALLLTTGRIFLLSLIEFSQYEELTRKGNTATMCLTAWLRVATGLDIVGPADPTTRAWFRASTLWQDVSQAGTSRTVAHYY
jgi:hypothetical protein